VRGDYKSSEMRIRALAERDGMNEAFAAGIARAIRGGGDIPGAVDYARAQWDAHPEWEGLREQVVDWLIEDERRGDALALVREAVKRRPDDLNAMRRLSILLIESGAVADVEEGVALVTKTLEVAPDNPFAYRMRADGNLALGKVAVGMPAVQAALSGYKASIAAAEANLRVARVAVEQTLIRAPFDGVVLTKNANVGDVITPFSSALGSQAAVVTMADMSTLEVEADVSEANLAKVKVGQPCEIQLDALPDQRFRGIVQRTVPTVDRAKATVMVKVRFVEPDARILPEMSAKVAFLEKELPDS
jgi:tetratricopeptide (TPR) repeat protein